MKAAIYIRVSTDKQELDNQLEPLTEFAKKRGYEIYKVYQDIASGNTSRRKGLNAMMVAAHQRAIDAIVVWSLDRLTREGLLKTIHLLEYLNKTGVSVISYTEPYLDTSNELARNILLAVISTLAKAEREKISERTKAGLRRLKEKGNILGRPRYPEKVRLAVIRSLGKGLGIRETARHLKVSPGYVCGVQKRGCEKQPPASV
jgi:DNA invertase Pin-like site-specific DNA recombinase